MNCNTDEEIYKGKAYKNVGVAVILGMISGGWLTCGAVLIGTDREWWSIPTFILSVLFFFVALFIGKYKLFPEEEVEIDESED